MRKLSSRLTSHPAASGGAAVGIAFLALYTYTLAPDVLGHDSGDWEAAGALLGLSHSPGSPAYTIIGWLFSRVPIGSLAARVNFVSAVIGAAGVAAVFVLMYMLVRHWLPALISAVTLGVAGLWWSQASVAEPYNSVPAAIAVLLILLLLWHRNGTVKLVWAGALIIGVELAYHPTLLYFTPVLLAGVIVLGPWRKLLSIKGVAPVVVLLIAGLSIYAYLPIRSALNPPVFTEKIGSLTGLWMFVTVREARTTGSFGVHVPGITEIRARLSELMLQGYLPPFVFLVFGPALTLLYPKVLSRLRASRRFLLFLLGGGIFHIIVIFAISGVFIQYYMPLLLYFAIWTGFSMYLIMVVADAYLPREKLRLIPVVALAAVYFVFLALGVHQVWPFVNHRQDRGMRDFSNFVFKNAQPGAVILANWESYTGLIYAQKVDGQGRDVTIEAVSQDAWRSVLPRIRAQHPGAEIMLARTLPFNDSSGTSKIGSWFFIEVKGRTYQDQKHGTPGPASVELYRVQ